MLILALESSAKAASVALCRDGVLIAQSQQCSGLTHSRTLLPMAEQMLKNTDTRLADVDAIAVARGPGSFTGDAHRRVHGQGARLGRAESPAVGVSTLEAMAYHGLAAGGGRARVRGHGCPPQPDLQRPVRDPGRKTGAALSEDRAISLAELGEELAETCRNPLFWLATAHSCVIIHVWTWASLRCWRRAICVSQSAWGVAMAAFGQTPAPAEELLPVYLRLSQAERERQARLAAQAAQE